MGVGSRPRISSQQREFIRNATGTVREIAAIVGVGKSTVHYHRTKDFHSDADADEDLAVQFETLQQPRRCSRHGLTSVWPCVRCVAESALYDR